MIWWILFAILCLLLAGFAVVLCAPLRVRLSGSYEDGCLDYALHVFWMHPRVASSTMTATGATPTGYVFFRRFPRPAKKPPREQQGPSGTHPGDPQPSSSEEALEEPLAPTGADMRTAGWAEESGPRDAAEIHGSEDAGPARHAPPPPPQAEKPSQPAPPVSPPPPPPPPGTAEGEPSPESEPQEQPHGRRISGILGRIGALRDQVERSPITFFLRQSRWRSKVVRCLGGSARTLLHLLRIDCCRVFVKASSDDYVTLGTTAGIVHSMRNALMVHGRDPYQISFEPVFDRDCFAADARLGVETSLARLTAPVARLLFTFPYFSTALVAVRFWLHQRRIRKREQTPEAA